jgi:dTDP-4-amino-4,6-dideoxygalactose transaminase
MKIPFNKPLILNDEFENLKKVFENDRFSGNGDFSKKCNKILENQTGCSKSIVTSSCTDALEMTSLLTMISPGDEVIMPSFTFVSTASAFELRKAKIVWCDIRYDTKNIDENKIEELITPKTKAIVVVHYAGVACEMDRIKEICIKHGIYLIEDAAQSIDCYYKGQHLGSIGDLGTLSFHETKNIHCGEGGALLVNNPSMVEKAEFIRDKGTNRSHFNQGKVDKYTWHELGSSYLMSELQAAFLYSQLKVSEEINENRLKSWRLYYDLLLKTLPKEQLPHIPEECIHNAHMFYVLANDEKEREELLKHLADNDINAIFHYIPLHEAPYWKGKYSNIHLSITEKVSKTIIRLPLFYKIKKSEILHIVDTLERFYKK